MLFPVAPRPYPGPSPSGERGEAYRPHLDGMRALQPQGRRTPCLEQGEEGLRGAMQGNPCRVCAQRERLDRMGLHRHAPRYGKQVPRYEERLLQAGRLSPPADGLFQTERILRPAQHTGQQALSCGRVHPFRGHDHLRSGVQCGGENSRGPGHHEMVAGAAGRERSKGPRAVLADLNAKEAIMFLRSTGLGRTLLTARVAKIETTTMVPSTLQAAQGRGCRAHKDAHDHGGGQPGPLDGQGVCGPLRSEAHGKGGPDPSGVDPEGDNIPLLEGSGLCDTGDRRTGRCTDSGTDRCRTIRRREEERPGAHSRVRPQSRARPHTGEKTVKVRKI